MFHAHDLQKDHEHVLNAFCYGNHSIGSETLPEMVHEYCAIHKCGLNLCHAKKTQDCQNPISDKNGTKLLSSKSSLLSSEMFTHCCWSCPNSFEMCCYHQIQTYMFSVFCYKQNMGLRHCSLCTFYITSQLEFGLQNSRIFIINNWLEAAGLWKEKKEPSLEWCC